MLAIIFSSDSSKDAELADALLDYINKDVEIVGFNEEQSRVEFAKYITPMRGEIRSILEILVVRKT